MQTFKNLDAVAAPIARPNVDTDQIVPARYLRKPRKLGFGDYLFRDLRLDKDGRERDFVLNKPPYRDAKILVAERNFGCGSSRESAVYALWDYGFRAVIAPSFGDIFFGNSFMNGLLLVMLPPADVAALTAALEAKPGAHMKVDLAGQTVTGAVAFPLFRGAGLPLDDRGFLIVDDALRSVADPRIFAVGDCATLAHYPEIPKAGVYAVRQAPVLWASLKAALDGRHPPGYRPQAGFLSLLNTADGRALLVLVTHHLISDHWSWQVLLSELTTLLAGGNLPPANEVRYLDYVAWSRSATSCKFLSSWASPRILPASAFCLRVVRSMPVITSARCRLSVSNRPANSRFAFSSFLARFSRSRSARSKR